MTIKPFAFSFGEKPKPIYLYTDIFSFYDGKTILEIEREIDEKWVSNPDIIILNDKDLLISKLDEEINISDFEKEFENKMKNLENEF